MMKKVLAAAAIAVALVAPARADYVIKDGNGTIRTIKAGTVSGNILPYSSLTDVTGAPITAVNPMAVTFGTGVLLPSFAVPQHFVCDSGCSTGSGGLTVTYGGAIGTLGTPGGFKDASGNLQPLLGDVTNGQWVNIKASVPIALTGTLPAFAATPTVNIGSAPTIAVTGAFFQATQPVSIASSVAVTGTFFQATQPVSGTVTANAGTNMSTAALALETGGNLAALNTKTPALGQALAAASVPVVLTAAQITSLTPLSTVTVTQGTGTNLHVVCDSGCAGGGGGGAVTIASGGVASGAYAAGSLAAGAGVDGWDLTQGTKADTAYAGTGSASVISALKGLYTVATQPLAAGTALIGATNTFQGGAALSATNGLYSNVLQGNTVLSATNGIYANLLVGNVAVATGTGAQGSTSPRFTVATDSATIAGSASMPPGTNIMGKVGVDQTTQGTTNGVVHLAATVGGATPSSGVAAASNNATNLKASAGTVYSIQTSNISASTPYYIKLYDKATTPTCGTDTPVARYVIPPSNGGNNVVLPVGKAFLTGIGFCITTGIPDTDNIAVPAATVLFNIDWK